MTCGLALSSGAYGFGIQCWAVERVQAPMQIAIIRQVGTNFQSRSVLSCSVRRSCCAIDTQCEVRIFALVAGNLFFCVLGSENRL